MHTTPSALASNTSETFEGLLLDVEHSVDCAGQLLLFAGEQLRLEVGLLRDGATSRLIWGRESHEDWAFKATLLRFARGQEPVRLLLSTGEDDNCRLRAWVVKRTPEAFWACPLPFQQTIRFWESCLARLDLEDSESLQKQPLSS